MNPLVAPHAGDGEPTGTSLSVNVNKVALLRNTRTVGVPDVVALARIALAAGAHGITVHPRPDARHIRRDDVLALGALLAAWPHAEFNVEGNPTHNLLDELRALRAAGLPVHQATFVPDAVGQSTSDHGWRFPDDAVIVAPLVAEARALGVRVSLFVDPDPAAAAGAAAAGADCIELYTEGYARMHAAGDTPAVAAELARHAATARAAQAAGLAVNAGHDLNRANLADFVRGVPEVAEVSIGHALVADALELGMDRAVREYLRCLRVAHDPRVAPTR